QSDVAFPLTPALSLRERENAGQRVAETGTSEIVERLPSVLPLPKGEGWGEGEQAAPASKPLAAMNRLSILFVFICANPCPSGLPCSNHLDPTRRGHRVAPVRSRLGRRLHAVPTVLRLGRVIEIGRHDLLPGNFLARVTGNLPHDADHGAAGH